MYTASEIGIEGVCYGIYWIYVKIWDFLDFLCFWCFRFPERDTGREEQATCSCSTLLCVLWAEVEDLGWSEARRSGATPIFQVKLSFVNAALQHAKRWQDTQMSASQLQARSLPARSPCNAFLPLRR